MGGCTEPSGKSSKETGRGHTVKKKKKKKKEVGSWLDEASVCQFAALTVIKYFRTGVHANLFSVAATHPTRTKRRSVPQAWSLKTDEDGVQLVKFSSAVLKHLETCSLWCRWLFLEIIMEKRFPICWASAHDLLKSCFSFTECFTFIKWLNHVQEWVLSMKGVRGGGI